MSNRRTVTKVKEKKKKQKEETIYRNYLVYVHHKAYFSLGDN